MHPSRLLQHPLHRMHVLRAAAEGLAAGEVTAVGVGSVEDSAAEARAMSAVANLIQK